MSNVAFIEPSYKTWIDQAKGNIGILVDNLTSEMKDLNQSILYTNKSDKSIQDTITDLKKKLLYARLAYNEKKLESNNTLTSQDTSVLDNKFKILQNNMDLITVYDQNNILSKQKKGIDLIAIVSLIFLPLTLITGYYGMNFGSMGNPSKNYGPFGFKYGQIFVLFLFLMSIIGVVLFLKFYYK
jgi:Mg2+ and Co2+ transporter CorA